MELTVIGAIQLIVGLALFMFGSLRTLFAFVMVATLLGGSAAIQLTALGGSSIAPAHFALGFLLLRCLLPDEAQGLAYRRDFVEALRANAWLVLFVCYGIIAALLLPRIFAGEIDVTPLRGQIRARYGTLAARIFATAPLRFSAQNITTAVYMTGTLLMALTAYTVMKQKGSARLLARAAGWLGLIHALTGLASVALRGTPVDAVFAFFRNGSYAQLDHEWNGFVRMNGLWPEASAFAAWAIVWFVFNFEAWLRGIEPRVTGPAALALGAALVLSTSSSAYVGLALFAACTGLRALTCPGLFPRDRLATLALAGLAGLAGVLAIMVLDPALAKATHDLFEHMTLDKADSFSGRQRLFWASQGLEAFMVSHGLGIGPGSFRSSSLLAAILGSLGIVGMAAFILHAVRAFKPQALSTWLRSGEPERDTAVAAAWAMLVGVGVASVSAPSCDPGLNFAILSGAAIALRRSRQRVADAGHMTVAHPAASAMPA